MVETIGAAWRGVRDLIQGAVHRAGQGRADLIRGFADTSKGAARSLSRADLEGRDRVKWLTGTTFDGQPIRFRPRKVWSMPLRDAHGMRIGAVFAPDMARESIRWAEQTPRWADTQVMPIELTDSGTWRAAEDAPWADAVRDSGEPPNYFIAHADPHYGQVSVNTGSRLFPKWVDVDLTGSELGRTLEAVKNSARAIKRNPAGEQVLVMCRSGAPNASTARMAAAHLHSTGTVTGKIHAPINEVSNIDPSILRGNRVSTELYVERPAGSGGKLFETYRAPGSDPGPPADS